MKPTSQLQQLLDLDIPFAVLQSNSYLGSDTFMVALASDCRRHGLVWEESFSQPFLQESALDAADMETFSQLRRELLLLPLSLGVAGMVYELAKHPFRLYYQQATARRRLDEVVLPAAGVDQSQTEVR